MYEIFEGNISIHNASPFSIKINRLVPLYVPSLYYYKVAKDQTIKRQVVVRQEMQMQKQQHLRQKKEKAEAKKVEKSDPRIWNVEY